MLFEESPAYVLQGKPVAVLSVSLEGVPEIVEKYGEDALEAAIAHEIGHLIRKNEYASVLEACSAGSLGELAWKISKEARANPNGALNLTEFFCDVLSEHLTGKMVSLRRKIYADGFREGEADYLLSHLPAYALSERVLFGDYSAMLSNRADGLPNSLFWDWKDVSEYCLTSPLTEDSSRAPNSTGYYSRSEQDRKMRMCGVP